MTDLDALEAPLDLEAIEDLAEDARAFQGTADGSGYARAAANAIPQLIAEVRKLREEGERRRVSLLQLRTAVFYALKSQNRAGGLVPQALQLWQEVGGKAAPQPDDPSSPSESFQEPPSGSGLDSGSREGAETESGPHRCPTCSTLTVYASFSGGREYYCPTCDDNGLYPQGAAPPRLQMLADGRFDELRTEMRDEIARRKGGSTADTRESR